MIRETAGQVRGELVGSRSMNLSGRPRGRVRRPTIPGNGVGVGVILSKDNPEPRSSSTASDSRSPAARPWSTGVTSKRDSRPDFGRGVLLLETQIDGASQELTKLPLDERVRKPTVSGNTR